MWHIIVEEFHGHISEVNIRVEDFNRSQHFSEGL